ncbi:Homocysteine S-methyltransferase family protein [Rhynchospora pubera]|uniref:homocysteine S-methyltransferase n=1 Tax=Rhynchospora pubera TaxID=906938 RepID=A0AAV8DK54_9POAL|nr:Homocysteine S-methyltransferase family protein [Rhynchospora pubera]
MGVTKGPLEELIEKAGGCAVIDGGFATQLEALGADINDPLWSALCLISNPHLIKKVHMQYLEAGADVLITSSYQATIPGFLSKGLSIEEAEKLLQKSVKLAIEARDNFWTHLQKNPKDGYNRALVAASIGSYGAYLADGSEYSGGYGPDIELDKLKDFHRRRLQVLASAEPDLLAFEAIPNKLEAQAIVELLNEEKVNIPSWICFSSVDGKHTPSGHSFKECLEILNCCERVPAIGVNCTSPHFIDKLIHELRKFTKKAIVVYPNSGEIWDGRAKKWMPSECFGDGNFEALALKWHESGANLIGGCCRTTPNTIQAITKALKSKR